MKVFYEAILELEVPDGMSTVYKKAIEQEHDRYWVQNKITNKDGKIINTELKPVWSGNYVTVAVLSPLLLSRLEIAIVSHTLPNLLATVKSYQSMGATIKHKNYEEEK